MVDTIPRNCIVLNLTDYLLYALSYYYLQQIVRHNKRQTNRGICMALISFKETLKNSVRYCEEQRDVAIFNSVTP